MKTPTGNLVIENKQKKKMPMNIFAKFVLNRLEIGQMMLLKIWKQENCKLYCLWRSLQVQTWLGQSLGKCAQDHRRQLPHQQDISKTKFAQITPEMKPLCKLFQCSIFYLASVYIALKKIFFCKLAILKIRKKPSLKF